MADPIESASEFTEKILQARMAVVEDVMEKLGDQCLGWLEIKEGLSWKHRVVIVDRSGYGYPVVTELVQEGDMLNCTVRVEEPYKVSAKIVQSLEEAWRLEREAAGLVH